MPYRKTPLVESQIYHIFTKSIAGFRIFNSDYDFERILAAVCFYTTENPLSKLSLFIEDKINLEEVKSKVLYADSVKIVEMLAYCFMPTHIHLVLKQLRPGGISKFINVVLKSYSKYFNVKYKRKGPLWEGRFRSVLVETDEQFLHLTRYVHLNPVSISLVDNPEDWKSSSYGEYIGRVDKKNRICAFDDYLDMDYSSYRKFVEDRIDYQRELEQIKNLIIE